MTNDRAGASPVERPVGRLEPKRDRQTTEPGGCECHHCGCIFIGGPSHTACGVCDAAFAVAMDEDYAPTRSQRMRAAGYTRRASAKSLPSDE